MKDDGLKGFLLFTWILRMSLGWTLLSHVPTPSWRTAKFVVEEGIGTRALLHAIRSSASTSVARLARGGGGRAVSGQNQFQMPSSNRRITVSVQPVRQSSD
jgi:hypothetical protein